MARVKKEVIQFRLKPEDAAKLRQRAAARGTTVSAMLRFMVLKWLDKSEQGKGK